MSEPEWSLPMNRAELIARVEALEKEQWLVAECIFQNVSAGEMRHWAQGIKVSLSGADKVPRFTAETPVQPARTRLTGDDLTFDGGFPDDRGSK